MNNTEAATAFLDWLRVKRGASRHTLTKYRTVIAAFDRWGEGRPFAAMTDLDIESFTMERPRRGGVQAAPATVTLETAALRSLYRWGQARLGWAVNPAALATHPKVRNRQPRPVSDDLWLSVWMAELPMDARVALGLGFFCGLRRQEIVTIRGEQVWGRALVNFIRKGGGEDRFDYGDALDHWAATMPELRPELLETPLKYLAWQRGPRLLMPWGDDYISDTGLNKRLYRWLGELGLPEDAFGPHQLRHSFATNLLRTGVPLHMASDLCNHSDINTTMRYIRTAGGRLRTLRDSGVGVAPLAAGETR